MADRTTSHPAAAPGVDNFGDINTVKNLTKMFTHLRSNQSGMSVGIFQNGMVPHGLIRFES